MTLRRSAVTRYLISSIFVAACIAHPTYILAVNDTDHDPGWNTSSSPSLTGSLPISHPNRISHSHPAWCLALPSSFNAVRIAHAVLGGCAFLIFFPLGGTVMLVSRHPKAVYVHAALQTFAYLVSTIAAGLGIWMAKKVHSMNDYHPIIGLVILGLCGLQLLSGLTNHLLRSRLPRVALLAQAHLWTGRALITVGIINGGLGFQFASTFPDQQPSNAPRVVYGVIATLVWIIYVSIIAAWTELERNPTCVGTRRETTGLTQTAGRRSPVDTPTTGNSADDLQSHGVSETDADQDITEVVQREPNRT